MKIQWLFFLCLLFILSPVHASPEFTDSEAKKVPDRRLNEGCTPAIALGAVVLQVGERDINYPGEIRERYPTEAFMHSSAHMTPYMYAMEERGIIEIERLWTDANQKWQEARVKLTRKGEALRKLSKQERDDLGCVKWGSGRVTHVGRNEEVLKNMDVYRVVMAVFEMKWTPEILLLSQLRGDENAEKRKLIALVKHDPFQSRWEVVTWDVANFDDDFKTSNVSEKLERR